MTPVTSAELERAFVRHRPPVWRTTPSGLDRVTVDPDVLMSLAVPLSDDEIVLPAGDVIAGSDHVSLNDVIKHTAKMMWESGHRPHDLYVHNIDVAGDGEVRVLWDYVVDVDRYARAIGMEMPNAEGAGGD